jgi:hypothetical protein
MAAHQFMRIRCGDVGFVGLDRRRLGTPIADHTLVHDECDISNKGV